MPGRPRTRLAERLVAEALELLAGLERPVFPDALRDVLHRLADSELEHEAVEIAMRRLARHPLIVVGADGLIAHRVLTNGHGAHA
jgi:hypothetical protein